MKFCVDCKHFIGKANSLTCGSPLNSVPSVNEAAYLVSGIEQPVVMAMRGASCSALRLQRAPEIDALVCGPDGKWFEAKE